MSNKIVCGLTRMQWKIAVDEKLIVEYWDNEGGADGSFISVLVGFYPRDDYPFIVNGDFIEYKYCRIHKSQLQFNTGVKPDWLHEDDSILCKRADGIVYAGEAMIFDFSETANEIIRWQRVML